MKINPLSILHGLIIWQSLLFALLLLTPRYLRRKENIFLSLLLITLAVHFSYNLLYINKWFAYHLISYSCSYGFLYGPLLYLNTRARLQENFRFRVIDIFHFTPFAVIVTSTSFGFHICNYAWISIFPFMGAYCVLAFLETFKKKKSTIRSRSATGLTILTQIRLTIAGMALIIIMNVIQQRYPEFSFRNYVLRTEILLQVLILLEVNLIILLAFSHPFDFQNLPGPKIPPAGEREILIKIAEKLEFEMTVQRVYKNPDLSMERLSEILGFSERMISQSINHVFKMNLSEYVNSHRVEEVKRLLTQADQANLTIKEAMYEAGFNSRSVFNTVFRAKTGLTPGDYRKQHY